MNPAALFGAVRLCLFCLFLATPPAAPAADATYPKNVLMLMSSEYGLPAYDIIVGEIRTGLKKGFANPLNLYAEYMDTARFPMPHHGQALVDFYTQKYGELQIDLLIAIGPNLAATLPQFGQGLFSDVPTLLLDLVPSNADLPAVFRKPNMTGIFPEVDIPNTIASALAFHPKTKHIFVVSGASALDLSLEALARAACRRYESTIRVHHLGGMTMAAILRTVAALPNHSVVLFTAMQMDAFGVPYYTREATALVAARSKAPVYGLFDTNADVGGVGGHVIRFKNVGIAAAEIALRVLRGESPAAIPPIRKGMHQYLFDWRQIERWGIPTQRLPAGSILLNRESGLIREYGWAIIGVMLFIACQSALLAYLAVINRRRKALSTKLSEAEDRYRGLLRVERTTRLGELAGSLAHELSQPLSAILSSSQAALRFLKSGRLEPRLFREILEHIVSDNKRAAAIISSLRAMLKKSRTEKAPLALNEIVGEVVAIFQGEAAARRTRIERDLDVALPPVAGSKTELQQVILNLVMNAADAMSHCEPSERRMVLRSRLNGSCVTLSVRDNGRGIDPAKLDHLFDPFFTTKSGGLGMGLALCRTIMEDHGGGIRAQNNPEGGATFTIELPAVKND